MSDLAIAHERISFQHLADLPEIQARLCACRSGPTGKFRYARSLVTPGDVGRH
ncbi:MAG: hypothetical protein J7M08_02120 [Planctomycetes bacterium]|nr:hypothetical protein [Planctomycetota bacterium]